MEHVITISISFITAIITALIAYFFSIRSERIKAKSELDKTQRHEYFLPFKYCAKEFLARIKHIEERVSEKDEIYAGRFSPKMVLVGKDLSWYFEVRKSTNPGGYFTTSTIYMTCLLFHHMKRIQWEYPFIPLKFEKSISSITLTADKQIKRCLESWHNDSNKSNLDLENIKDKQEINIDKIIEFIRVPLALRAGIPYSLHDSYGDFISTDNGVMNFEQFAKELADKDKAIKFQPIIDFWTQIADKDNGVNELRIDKLRKLIVILTLIEYGKIN